MITGDPIAPAHATPEPGGGSTALPWWKANKPDLVLYTCDRKTPAWECFAGEGCSHVFVPLDLKNPATLEYQMESGVLPAAKLGYRQCKIRVLAELESALLGLCSAPHPHPNQLSTQPTFFFVFCLLRCRDVIQLLGSHEGTTRLRWTTTPSPTNGKLAVHSPAQPVNGCSCMTALPPTSSTQPVTTPSIRFVFGLLGDTGGVHRPSRVGSKLPHSC